MSVEQDRNTLTSGLVRPNLRVVLGGGKAEMAGNVSWYEDYIDTETPDCSLCHNLTNKHCHHTGQSPARAREQGEQRYKWPEIDLVAQWWTSGKYQVMSASF